MKQSDFNQMNEEQLMDFYCEKSHELADLTRIYYQVKKDMSTLVKHLDYVDLAMEAIEAKKLRSENKLT